MAARFIILAGFLLAGLASPLLAAEPRWIDPWAVDELAGASEPDFQDPADLTGSIDTVGFIGGVGAARTVIVVPNGFYFNRTLPAGQIAMTGDRARPVHPLGHPRFSR